MIGFDKHGSGGGGVIVLNDWLSDTSTWDEARRYLGSEDFTWVFADLRGYGRSRGQGGRFTIIEAAGDVIALADSLGWGRFAIVGHSMSALVALHLAQHHPNRVERTVLVTPSPPRGFGFDDVTMQALRAGASGDDAARLGLLRRMQGTRLTEQWIRLKLERWRMSSDSEAVAGYTSMWAREGLPDPEAKVASPLLAITGEDDREDMRADATSAALRPLASDLTVVPLADCGHAPMQEMPPLFATVVERFLLGSQVARQSLGPQERTHGTGAYLVVQGTVRDDEAWRRYGAAVVPLIASFGGKHLTKGGGAELLEGGHANERTALFGFPSMDAIHAFWASPEYAPVKELRRDAATLDIWAVPGSLIDSSGCEAPCPSRPASAA